MRVNGAYFPAFQDAVYLNNNGAHRRAYAGVSAGLEYFGGGAGLMDTFFGSDYTPANHPEQFSTVEIRHSHTDTQKAYRYFRDELAGGAGPPTGRGYWYGGFVPCNFQVWDVTNDVQLDAALVERRVVDNAGVPVPAAQQPASLDSTWAPLSDDLDTGDREYLAIYRSVYTDTPKDEFREDGVHGLGNGTGSVRDMGDTPGGPRTSSTTATCSSSCGRIPATNNDVYDIRHVDAAAEQRALASRRARPGARGSESVLHASTYEMNQFNRVMRFMNMPETCTVRIFNLGGDLVRTLQQDGRRPSRS